MERHDDPNYVTPRHRYHACEIVGCTYAYRCGRYCEAHKRRNRLYGNPLAGPTRPLAILTRCAHPDCAGNAGPSGYCRRCERRRKAGRLLDPLFRRYPKLCSVAWCPERASAYGYCPVHRNRFEKYGDPLKLLHEVERPPHTCVRESCTRRALRRGLCEACLEKAAEQNMLFREYLLHLPESQRRGCIGKPRCRRWSVLFGRCPDCLYDWQFTIRPSRNFFKSLFWA